MSDENDESTDESSTDDSEVTEDMGEDTEATQEMDAPEAESDAPEAEADAPEAEADAPVVDADTHRGVLAGVLDTLQQNGVDIDALAQRAGVATADVDALKHDDLMQLAQYVQQNHPEVLQMVAARIPAAQGLLGMLGGGSGGDSGGGGIGGMIGRFLGGGQ